MSLKLKFYILPKLITWVQSMQAYDNIGFCMSLWLMAYVLFSAIN